MIEYGKGKVNMRVLSGDYMLAKQKILDSELSFVYLSLLCKLDRISPSRAGAQSIGMLGWCGGCVALQSSWHGQKRVLRSFDPKAEAVTEKQNAETFWENSAVDHPTTS